MVIKYDIDKEKHRAKYKVALSVNDNWCTLKSSRNSAEISFAKVDLLEAKKLLDYIIDNKDNLRANDTYRGEKNVYTGMGNPQIKYLRDEYNIELEFGWDGNNWWLEDLEDVNKLFNNYIDEYIFVKDKKKLSKMKINDLYIIHQMNIERNK